MSNTDRGGHVERPEDKYSEKNPEHNGKKADPLVDLGDGYRCRAIDPLFDKALGLGATKDGLVQRTCQAVFEHVNVVLPVFLPELAAAIYEKPRQREEESDAGNHKGVERLAFNVFGRLHCEEACEGDSDQCPEVRRALPIQPDLEFPNVQGQIESF